VSHLDDPDEGLMLLSYELIDDPAFEHELWVNSLDEARRHLSSRADMVVWATLTDSDGDEVCGKEALL